MPYHARTVRRQGALARLQANHVELKLTGKLLSDNPAINHPDVAIRLKRIEREIGVLEERITLGSYRNNSSH